MNRWSWFLYAGRKAFSRAAWQRWAGIVVGSLALVSVLGGFVLLVVTIAAWTAAASAVSLAQWSTMELTIRLVIAAAMIGIGVYWMAGSIWKVATLTPGRKTTSADRQEIVLSNERVPVSSPFPTVPAPRGVVRGDVMPYRLTGANPDLGWMIGAGIASLVSVGLLTVLCWFVWQTYDAGTVDWWALGAAVCCIPVVAWSVYRFFLKFLVFVAFGPSRLEISQYPLAPGQTVQLSLRQPGQMRLHLLEVVLLCQEVVTYSQGTNVRTETRNVVEQRLFRQRGIAAAEPFQCEFEMAIPRDAMHSFSADSNRIQWKIIVSASVRGWPRFERAFPIIVQPPPA